MTRPSRPTQTAGPLLLLLLLGSTASPSSAAATAPPSTFDCAKVEFDGHTYDFHDLAGPHTIVTTEYAAPTYRNTTYTIDLCGPLKRKGDIAKEERCPDGTRVCAIKHRFDPKTGKSVTDSVIPIVIGHGNDHAAFNWGIKRIAEGRDTKDKKNDGLRLTLQSDTTYQQRPQSAVISLRCDPEKVGTEGEWEQKLVEYEPAKKNSKRGVETQEDTKKEEKDPVDISQPEHQLRKQDAALLWEGYKREQVVDGTETKEIDTLYLTWYTKHACRAEGENPPTDGGKESKHWGFFTWVFIIAFLAVASYLIFGSWLNYHRYGARGWDLLPHSDLIRDIPYLLRDVIRRVLNTVQSSGSRGGYSAV